MRKRNVWLVLLLVILLCTGCHSEPVYTTVPIGEPSDLEVVSSGENGVTLSITPEYADGQWMLYADYSFEQSDDLHIEIGNHYRLEYFHNGMWYTIPFPSDRDSARGAAVTDIAYSIPKQVCFETEVYGTLLYEGTYRVLCPVSINGSGVFYSAEFDLSGNGTIPFENDT